MVRLGATFLLDFENLWAHFGFMAGVTPALCWAIMPQKLAMDEMVGFSDVRRIEYVEAV